MPDRSKRLRQARKAAGFTSASDAARRLGISIPTYTAHENGGRAFSAEDATVYARRFGVTLEWLLTGEGERTAPGVPVIATPIIGTLSKELWAERPVIDLAGEFPQLEIAILVGGHEDIWFAVHVGDAGSSPVPAEPGDHLICRATDEPLNNGYCVVDRAGFGGQLRQLIPAMCITEGGESHLYMKDAKGRFEERIEGEFTVLGRIESLYRSL